MTRMEQYLTINTSNSSIARNGASVISCNAKAKHRVENDRSPPNIIKSFSEQAI